MSRESAVAKGARYLVEGRLVVELVEAQRIVASCRGAGEIYQLGYSPGGWWCSCPVLGRCSHLHALMTVTVAPPVARACHSSDEKEGLQ